MHQDGSELKPPLRAEPPGSPGGDVPSANDRRLALALAATVGAALVALPALIWHERAFLGAPRISASVAFNEKARWIGEALKRNPSPDVLVVGSSMALNNFDGVSYGEITPRRSVMNLGSWGMGLEEDEKLLHLVAAEIEHPPSEVIVPVWFGDFGSESDKEIDWAACRHVLECDETALMYALNLDPEYYLDVYRKKRENAKTGNRTYTSLLFDRSGSTLFSTDDFQITVARWNGHGPGMLATRPTRGSIEAVTRLARWCAEKGIRFCVVVCPLRPGAEVFLEKEMRPGLWPSVQRAVAANGGVFVQLQDGSQWTRADFVDFDHLRAAAAKRFTLQIAAALAGAPAQKPLFYRP